MGAFMGFTPVCKRASTPSPLRKTPLYAQAFCAYGENFLQPIHKGDGAQRKCGLARLWAPLWLYTRLQAGVPAPLCKTPLHA